MVVPTGTASPWREFSVTESSTLFMRDGHVSGSADLLAEALRADGLVRSLGRAIPIAEAALLEESYYGYVDEGDDPKECDSDGETPSGEIVDQVFPCVIAYVDRTES